MKLPQSEFSARNIPAILASHLHLSSSPLQGHHHPWTSRWVYTSVNSRSLWIQFMNIHRSQPFVCDLHMWTVCKFCSWNASSWPTLSATMQQHWLQRTPIERLNALMQTHRKQVVDGKDSKNKSRFRGVHMYVQTNTSYRVGFSFLFVARKVIWMTDAILFILLGMPQSFITIKGDLMGTTGWEHRRSSGGE